MYFSSATGKQTNSPPHSTPCPRIPNHLEFEPRPFNKDPVVKDYGKKHLCDRPTFLLNMLLWPEFPKFRAGMRDARLRTHPGPAGSDPANAVWTGPRVSPLLSRPPCPHHLSDPSSRLSWGGAGTGTHPDSHGPSPTHAGPSGGAQPRSGPEPSSFALCSSPRGCDWEVRGRWVTVGCRDRVRGEKALPLLRTDFQKYLSVKT